MACANYMLTSTWSDDTSLTLCLLDNLDYKIDYNKIMNSFVAWYKEGKYSVDGYCFDIGIGTKRAIMKYLRGVQPVKCGSRRFDNNGNGSLMRMLPLVYYFYYNYQCIDRTIIKKVSSLTHGNDIAIMACEIYVELGYRLLNGEKIFTAYKEVLEKNVNYWHDKNILEIHKLENIESLDYLNLKGSGYVISTLQSALWSVLKTSSFEECILTAVKIGGDTDTIASVAGGLAGIMYGKESIPDEWIKSLRNKKLIDEICEKFMKKIKE